MIRTILKRFGYYPKADFDGSLEKYKNKVLELNKENKTYKLIINDYKNELSTINKENSKFKQAIEYYDNELQTAENENIELKKIITNYQSKKNEYTLNIPKLEFVESDVKSILESYQIEFNKDDEEIREFIESNELGNPTDEQWKVILCRNSTQLVAAAAGSGKSTTMLLRVLVLIKFANINPNDLVVFSFTKKSCIELREKLEKLFKKIELNIDKLIIEKMIRTFHSKVYEVAKESGILGSYKLFEFIKDNEINDNDDEIDIEIDNTFNSTLNYTQLDILKQVYTNVYNENEHFKKLIHEIFLRSNLNKLSLKMGEKKGISKIEFALDFSENLCKVFKNAYETTLDINIKRKIFSKDVNTFFYYHYYLENLNVYLIFNPNKNVIENLELMEIEIENNIIKKQFKLLLAKNIHKKVYSHCDSRVVFVENQQHLDNLLLVNQIYNDSKNNNIPIIFDIKISTQYREKLIFEFFYTLINFIESAGISFEQLECIKEDIIKSQTLDNEHEDIFVAMMIYWDCMNKYFKENKIYQFSNLLKYFSENNIKYFNYTSSSIQSMKNILIDEFQDISPEIVTFIRGAQKHLYEQDKQTTLMCIGDDWQSIYGWRGSSPSYLIDFKEHFNCKHDELIMSINFRSSQNILSKAGMILERTKIKLKKNVDAFYDYPDSEFKKVNLSDESNYINPKKIIEDINRRIIEIRSEWSDATIYVLCRQNTKSYHKIKGADEILSFHSSKGLEADICFLIGDCNYKEKDIIRNLIYRLAKYKQSYDESQQDESLRLAYVAATRAKRQAYWYGLEDSDFGYILEYTS